MTSTAPDLRIESLEAHPRLFHGPIERPYAAEGYSNCEEGWRDLLERACARIEAALVEGGAFRALQIKEKFGTLRFYWDGDMSDAAKAKVEEAIALAVARSACIVKSAARKAGSITAATGSRPRALNTPRGNRCRSSRASRIFTLSGRSAPSPDGFGSSPAAATSARPTALSMSLPILLVSRSSCD
jgi:hypothetical protein